MVLDGAGIVECAPEWTNVRRLTSSNGQWRKRLHPGVSAGMKRVRVLTSLAVLFALAVPAAASAAGTDFPLRGWWPLNEGRGQAVYDWSGKGNNGFLGSTPQADSNDPSWTKGVFFGSALSFGGDDFIAIPDVNDSLEPQALTVSAWVRASQSPGTYRYLLAKGGQDCVTSSYGLQTSYHGGLEFFIWDGQNQRWSGNVAADKIWDGRWHQVAGTYDGTNAKLFVDGIMTNRPRVLYDVLQAA